MPMQTIQDFFAGSAVAGKKAHLKDTGGKVSLAPTPPEFPKVSVISYSGLLRRVLAGFSCGVFLFLLLCANFMIF
jgi:hypothetical protein